MSKKTSEVDKLYFKLNEMFNDAGRLLIDYVRGRVTKEDRDCMLERLSKEAKKAILDWHTKQLAKEKMELVEQINSKHFICKQCGCVEKMNVNLETLKSEEKEEVGE